MSVSVSVHKTLKRQAVGLDTALLVSTHLPIALESKERNAEE